MNRGKSKCLNCYWAYIEICADPELCDEYPCSKGMPQTAHGYEYEHGLCPLFKPGKNPQVTEVENRQRRNGVIALYVVGGVVATPGLLRLLGLVPWSWEACLAPLIVVSCVIFARWLNCADM